MTTSNCRGVAQISPKKGNMDQAFEFASPSCYVRTSVAAPSKLKTAAKRGWSLGDIALLVCDETVCSSASWSVSGAG